LLFKGQKFIRRQRKGGVMQGNGTYVLAQSRNHGGNLGTVEIRKRGKVVRAKVFWKLGKLAMFPRKWGHSC